MTNNNKILLSQVPLKNIKMPDGTYILGLQNTPIGVPQPIQSIMPSAQPFDIVATFPNSSVVIVCRKPDGVNNTIGQLHMLDYKTGIIEQNTIDGVNTIAYNTLDQHFYIFNRLVPANSDTLVRWLIFQHQSNKDAAKELLNNQGCLQIINTNSPGIKLGTITLQQPKKKSPLCHPHTKLRKRAHRINRKNIQRTGARQKIKVRKKMTVPYSLQHKNPIRYTSQTLNKSYTDILLNLVNEIAQRARQIQMRLISQRQRTV